MSRRRLIVLLSLFLFLLIAMAVAASAAVANSGSGLGTALVVMVLFAASIAVGITVQCVRLIRSLGRSARLAQIASDSEVLSLFWNPVAWERIGVPRAPLVVRLARIAFATVGLTIDAKGLTFWYGSLDPIALRVIPWNEIEGVSESEVVVAGRSYPHLEIAPVDEGRILVQIESKECLLPTAKSAEIRALASRLGQFREA